MLASLSGTLRRLLPLPAWAIAARQLDRASATILDVGCGPGGPIPYLRGKRCLSVVGTDIFLPYLLQHLRAETYEALVRCDVRRLPFGNAAFDVLFCGEVLEHLDERDGRELLTSMERVARRQVIVTTPVGHCDQHPYDGNEHQAHRSAWTPAELRRLGYRVRGSGIHGMGGLIARENSSLPEWLRLLANAVWMAATPFSYFLPEIGGGMVCVKDVEGKRPETPPVRPVAAVGAVRDR